MRVLILGSSGLLGQAIVRVANRETDWQILKITQNTLIQGNNVLPFNPHDYKAWRQLIDKDRKPDVIVNTAAMTDVDKCEVDREQAWRINVNLVDTLAQYCRSYDIKLIQLSSDYVFDGSSGPYTEDDTPNPVNYYGRTKLAAENLCIRKLTDYTIIRTMWLYGEAQGGKTSFVDWVVKMLKKSDSFGVVTDEIGNPTLTDDIAYGIINILEKNYKGVLNIAGSDLQSRWLFATHIAQIYNNDPSIIKKISTRDLKRYAKRPHYSGLVTHQAQTILGLQPTPLQRGIEMMRIINQRQLLQDR